MHFDSPVFQAGGRQARNYKVACLLVKNLDFTESQVATDFAALIEAMRIFQCGAELSGS
jgi:hypothetical protein